MVNKYRCLKTEDKYLGYSVYTDDDIYRKSLIKDKIYTSLKNRFIDPSKQIIIDEENNFRDAIELVEKGYLIKI